jgi:hypothetical protein
MDTGKGFHQPYRFPTIFIVGIEDRSSLCAHIIDASERDGQKITASPAKG